MANPNPPLRRRNRPAGVPRQVTESRRKGQKAAGVQPPMANRDVEVHVAPKNTAEPSPPEGDAERAGTKKKGKR